MRINNPSIQQYYLRNNEDSLRNNALNMDFRQLLEHKINMAMDFNNHLSESVSDHLPASFFSDFMSMMNMSQSFDVQPTMLTSSPYTAMMDSYTNQINPLSTQKSSSVTPGSNKINGPTKYNHIIQEAAKKYNVDEQLIHAIIKTESNYNPNAKSHAGAAGLMQLMPGTARYLGVNDPYDIKQNIFGGTKYISDMLRQHNGNLTLALAAYNAGPGNVKKHGGIPPFKETQNYVKKIKHLLA